MCLSRTNFSPFVVWKDSILVSRKNNSRRLAVRPLLEADGIFLTLV